MAVENVNGTLVMDGLKSTPQERADSSFSGGRVRAFIDKCTVDAAASANSTYTVARIPTNAVILGQSQLRIDDLASAGAPTLDIGFVAVDGNITDDDVALNDGIDAATAGSYDVVGDIANLGKRVYEHLGLSEDPGGMVDVTVTLKDAAVNVGGDLVSELFVSID